MKIISVVRMLVPWLLLLAVTSCGTTGGYNDFAGGGIGGTGISVGKITASTGTSVAVNGVTFDTNNASVTLDGSAGNQSSLKVGMIVKVNGTFNEDGTTGVAASVEFKDNLEGPVDSVDPATNTIIVLGQTVILSSTTHFNDDFIDTNSDNLIDVNDINVGNVVEVSGFVDADGVIHASYISLKAEAVGSDGHEIEVKGLITYDANSGTFAIGSLTIDFSRAGLESVAVNAANNSLYVEVKSNSARVNNVLIASSIEIEDENHDADEGKRIEVEGYVTDVTDLADDKFEMEGQIVQITADTIFKAGSGKIDIILNAKVEVEGTIDAYGMLVAHEIKIEADDDGSGKDHSSSDSGTTDSNDNSSADSGTGSGDTDNEGSAG